MPRTPEPRSVGRCLHLPKALLGYSAPGTATSLETQAASLLAVWGRRHWLWKKQRACLGQAPGTPRSPFHSHLVRTLWVPSVQHSPLSRCAVVFWIPGQYPSWGDPFLTPFPQSPWKWSSVWQGAPPRTFPPPRQRIVEEEKVRRGTETRRVLVAFPEWPPVCGDRRAGTNNPSPLIYLTQPETPRRGWDSSVADVQFTSLPSSLSERVIPSLSPQLASLSPPHPLSPQVKSVTALLSSDVSKVSARSLGVESWWQAVQIRWRPRFQLSAGRVRRAAWSSWSQAPERRARSASSPPSRLP